MTRNNSVKREIKITLPIKQAELVHNCLVGEFGNNAADVVSTMVYDWLKDKGLLSFTNKKKRLK